MKKAGQFALLGILLLIAGCSKQSQTQPAATNSTPSVAQAAPAPDATPLATPPQSAAPAPDAGAPVPNADDPVQRQEKILLGLKPDEVIARCGAPLSDTLSKVASGGVLHNTRSMVYTSGEGGLVGVDFVEFVSGGRMIFAGMRTSDGTTYSLWGTVGKGTKDMSDTSDEIVTLLPCIVGAGRTQ